MRDIWSNAGDDVTDDGGACALTDSDQLRHDDEQCRQLQRENDFLRAQIAQAS